jgi:hypothetical protein
LARIVSWATPDDCAALTRLVRKARRDAFEVGKLNAEHEAGKGGVRQGLTTSGPAAQACRLPVGSLGAGGAMTEKTRDEVLAEYEAAARRSSALGHRWEQMVLIEPLRPGEHEPTITREQIELEDEMLRAWQDYLAKRNAYLAVTSTPEPA